MATTYDKQRYTYAILLECCLIAISLSSYGYAYALLMSTYTTKILPYFFLTDGLLTFAVTSLGLIFLRTHLNAFSNLFFIGMLVIFLALKLFMQYNPNLAVFPICILILTAFMQLATLIHYAISLVFDIREFRQLTHYIVISIGLSCIFVTALYFLLIKIFSSEVLFYVIFAQYLACAFLIKKLVSLAPKRKQSEGVASREKVEVQSQKQHYPKLIYYLVIYSVLIVVSMLLIDYVYLQALKQHFDKDAIALIQIILEGICSLLLVFIQIFGQQQLIRRYTAIGALALLPVVIIVTGIIAYTYPSLMTILFLYGLVLIFFNGSFLIGTNTILNTVTVSIRHKFRTLFDSVPYLIGRVVIAVPILLILGQQYATFQNVMLFVILCGIVALFILPWVRHGYLENLKRQVEIRRFFHLKTTDSSTINETNINVDEIGHKVSIQAAINFYNTQPVHRISEVTQDIEQSEDLLNARARIKVLSQLNFQEVEEFLLGLLSSKNIIILNRVAEAIAVRALSYKLSKAFQDNIKTAMLAETKKIILLARAMKGNYPDHLRLEFKGRHHISTRRFLYLFASLAKTEPALNTIPKILQQTDLKSTHEARANAIEYLDAISGQEKLRELLIETLEKEQKPISPEEFKTLLAEDAWLTKINLIEKFNPGVNMNTDERILLLHRINLYESIPPEVLEVYASHLEEITLKPKDVLFYQGEEADHLYLVVSGTIELTRDGAVMAEVHQDNLFGELALIDNEPRIATAAAKTESILLCFSKQDFIQLMEDVPAFSRAVNLQLVQYIRALLKTESDKI